MRTLFLTFALALLSFGAVSAHTPSMACTHASNPLDELDVPPTFQGKGVENFCYWVMTNVQYPAEAIEVGVEGLVLVSFVINTDGKMCDYEVLQTPSVPLSQAVIEVLEMANDLEDGWRPGQKDGKPVKVSFTIPVNFALPK